MWSVNQHRAIKLAKDAIHFPFIRLSQPNNDYHLTLEIVFGETRYHLARKRTDSPFAFLSIFWINPQSQKATPGQQRKSA
jgi:hypothetical protein